MWLEWLLLPLLLLVVLQALALWQMRGQLQQLQQGMDVLSRHMAHAGCDVPTSMLVAALGRVEKRLAQKDAPQAGTPHAYELAQQLARGGADAEQLMARCGLSRDEARLIRQLHPHADGGMRQSG